MTDTVANNRWQGVLSSAVDAVGNTPLIALDRLRDQYGVKCRILAKVEFFSVGGSVKDRIARRMIQKAEEDGTLVPGHSVIIEPTSGNTGIGLALISAIKGYRCIITLPDKMSREKEATLRALGAEVVRTPTQAAWDSEESHIGVAKKLRDAIPGGVILDQYSNMNNPEAHFYETYEEIKHSLNTSDLSSKHIAALVAGAGTGGTITGLSRALRKDQETQRAEHAVIVGVDPEGSILGGGEVGPYEVEGIGYDFIPKVLDTKKPNIDQWIKIGDDAAFAMVRQVIRAEGLLVGGSSGSALAGTLKFLRETPEGRAIAEREDANVIVVLPDGIRNYISKDWFLSGSLNAQPSQLSHEITSILANNIEPAAAHKRSNGIVHEENGAVKVDQIKRKEGQA